jgi:dTDP-4-dehydrorhamnose reductase
MRLLNGARVLVVGASGQLGFWITRAFADQNVLVPDRRRLDISDAAAVAEVVGSERPDVIINCAAFNEVDAAEDRPLDALAINAFGVRTLARAADAAGATLVHYSTDFVFDGTASTPYEETAVPAPRSTYAASKLLGEWFALDAERAFVLRVESLFGAPRDWTGRRGTLDGLVGGIEAGRELRVFTDRVVSPSYTPDIAAATRHLLDSGAAPGLYHCVNSGSATWQDVAQEAARLLGIAARLTPVMTNDVPLKASRPRYCALSNRKLAAAGFEMPSWQDALERWIAARAAGAS